MEPTAGKYKCYTIAAKGNGATGNGQFTGNPMTMRVNADALDEAQAHAQAKRTYRETFGAFPVSTETEAVNPKAVSNTFNRIAFPK